MPAEWRYFRPEILKKINFICFLFQKKFKVDNIFSEDLATPDQPVPQFLNEELPATSAHSSHIMTG